MALSAKDALTTLFAAGTTAVLYIQAEGISASFLTSPRWAGVIVFALGLAMCIVGADYTQAKGRFGLGMGIVGTLTLLTAILALITNSGTYVIIGAAIVLIMWAISTGRHAVSEP